MNLAEGIMPVTGLTSMVYMANAYVSAWLDNKTPTPDDLAKARMEGAINGGLFNLGMIAIVFTGPENAMTIAGLSGYFSDTVVQSAFGDTIHKAVNKFYDQHPVIEPKKDAMYKMDGPVVRRPTVVNVPPHNVSNRSIQPPTTSRLSYSNFVRASSATFSAYSYSYNVYSYSITSQIYHTSVFSATNGYYEMSNGRNHIS
jgi:hypothetical protein